MGVAERVFRQGWVMEFRLDDIGHGFERIEIRALLPVHTGNYVRAMEHLVPRMDGVDNLWSRCVRFSPFQPVTNPGGRSQVAAERTGAGKPRDRLRKRSQQE